MDEEIEVFVSFGNRGDFGFDSVDALVVGTTIGVLSFIIEPLILSFEEGKDFLSFFWAGESLMRSSQVGLPSVNERFELVFLFVGFEDEAVLIYHCGFDSEKGLNVFAGEIVEGVGIEFDDTVLFLLSLLNLEFLLFNLLRLTFFLGFTLFLWLFLLCFLFLGHLSFFKPFLNERAFFKLDKAIFIVADLEGDSKNFGLGVLRLSEEVANVLREAIHCGFVLNQHFNCLLASEFDGLAGRHLCSCLIDEFTLLFRVQMRIET